MNILPTLTPTTLAHHASTLLTTIQLHTLPQNHKTKITARLIQLIGEAKSQATKRIAYVLTSSILERGDPMGMLLVQEWNKVTDI